MGQRMSIWLKHLPWASGLPAPSKVHRPELSGLFKEDAYVVVGGPKLTMMQNIIGLLLDSFSKLDSHFVCPGGDCEIPAHWSLAPCWECENILQLNSGLSEKNLYKWRAVTSLCKGIFRGFMLQTCFQKQREL